jgi:hypothetical protein
MKGDIVSLEEKVLLCENFNIKCEYKEVCQYCKVRCSFGNRSECGDWHSWKYISLNELFKEKIDDEKNYLLF